AAQAAPIALDLPAQPLAAILTDLAWLLRAYSQSVSSDGAQHGEKTS
ncbi:hypothetical protein, partial [Pseudomonas aeruginosa]